MNWKALILLLMAWSTFAPFVNTSACAEESCCAQMQACCGHCHCTPDQICQTAKPPVTDQQTIAEQVQLSPRVDVKLFTLNFDFLAGLDSRQATVLVKTESPPPDTSQVQQARLCLWLI